jgi:hypothetical protein
MRAVSFYHKVTGVLHAVQVIASSDEVVALNTPPEHLAIEGHHDPLSKRVDVTTGAVVEHQPPAPSTDHAWNDETKRWALKPEIAVAQARRAAALTQIATLEASQQRAMRELLIDLNDATAKQRLLDIDEQIGALRSGLASEITRK